MRFSRICVAAAVAVTVSVSEPRAQISTTPLGNLATEVPMSVVLAPNALTLHAIVSTNIQGRQIPINVTNPAAPVVGASALANRDQFCRSWYSPAFNGRLFTAHRSGGIRMWDATRPSLAGPLTEITNVSTQYSHEGLKAFTDPQNRTWLYYGEHATSSSSSGGLIVYEVGASTLTLRAQALALASTGNGLEVSNNGRYVWQMGDRNNNNLDGILRVYDTANKNAASPSITALPSLPLPGLYTVANYDRYLEKNANESTLVSTNGVDGIQCFNISNPASPALGMLFQFKPLVNVRGVTFVPGTNFATVFGFVQVGTSYADFLWFIQTDVFGPGTFNFLGGPIYTTNFLIQDIKISAPRIYVVGRDRTTLTSELRIY